jgi:hypothetical protein
MARRTSDPIEPEAQLRNSTGLIVTGCRLKSDVPSRYPARLARSGQGKTISLTLLKISVEL